MAIYADAHRDVTDQHGAAGLDTCHPARPPLRPVALGKWMWQLGKDVIDEYREDGVGDLAASITFWTLLSIPAAILALISALSSVEAIGGSEAAENLEREIQELISDTFADSRTLNEAIAELFQGSNTGVLTFATAVAVFSLSRGFAGMIRALDRAYEVEEGRSWWHLRLVAIALGISTIVLAAGSSVILAILPDLPGGSGLRLLAAPVAFALIVLWAATLFHVGPHHRTPWRYDLPGALITATGWVAATQGFAVYVRVAGQGNQVQSTVGAVLLAFTLMYLLSNVMLVGAEVNDVITRRAGVVQQPVAFRARYEQVVELLGDRAEEDGANDTTTETTSGRSGGLGGHDTSVAEEFRSESDTSHAPD